MRHRRADIKKTAAWCASHSTGAHPARPALAPQPRTRGTQVYPRPPSNKRTAMSCVSAAGSGRAVLAPRASAGSGRASRAVVRARGGSRGRVTARRARVLTRSVADEDLDAQGTPRFRPAASPPRPTAPRHAPPPRAWRFPTHLREARRSSRVSSRATSPEARPSSRETPSRSRATSDVSRLQTAPAESRTRLTDVANPFLPSSLRHRRRRKQPRRSSRRSRA